MIRRFWRREQFEQAKRAKEESERERPSVERLVYDLRARRPADDLAPMVSRALRLRRP